MKRLTGRVCLARLFSFPKVRGATTQPDLSSPSAHHLLTSLATDFISPATSVATLSRSAEGRSFIPSLCDAARESGIWVSVGVHESPDAPVHVAGATPSPPQGKKMQDEQRCWNSQVLIDAEGVVRANYRKVSWVR